MADERTVSLLEELAEDEQDYAGKTPEQLRAELRDRDRRIRALQRKLQLYRTEVLELRDKLEESAYNEPEEELNRTRDPVQKIDQEAQRAEAAQPPTAPAAPAPVVAPPPTPTRPRGLIAPNYFRKLGHRFRKPNVFMHHAWPLDWRQLLWSFTGSFLGTAGALPSGHLRSSRIFPDRRHCCSGSLSPVHLLAGLYLRWHRAFVRRHGGAGLWRVR